MTHAHQARPGKARDAGAGRKRAWEPGGAAWIVSVGTWLAFLACFGARMFTSRSLVLDVATLATGAATVVLSSWVLARLWQEVSYNTARITGMRAGLEAATRYAFPAGGDGAAACPMGGGEDCPQSRMTARDYARPVNGLSHDGADRHPG